MLVPENYTLPSVTTLTSTDAGVTTDLIQLITLSAQSSEEISAISTKYSCALSAGTQKLLTDIVKLCPDFYKTVSIDLQAIFADGKVDLFDIPAVLNLCVNVYDSQILKKLPDVPTALIVEALKIIVFMLIDKNIIKFNSATELAQIVQLINVSATLLERVIGSKTVASCFSCCKTQ